MTMTQARSANNRVELEAQLNEAKKLFELIKEGLRSYLSGSRQSFRERVVPNREKLYALLSDLLRCEFDNLSAEAHYLFGRYLQETGDFNLKTQLIHFQTAVKKGYEPAKPEVVKIHFQLGFEKLTENPVIATEFLAKAADAKLPAAQYWLARRYSNGFGEPYKDVKTIINLLEQAAEQKHANAINWLGLIHINGQYVEKDHKKAVNYLQQSVDLDCPNAMHNLASCYVNGLGVVKDKNKANKLFLKADTKLKKDIDQLEQKQKTIQKMGYSMDGLLLTKSMNDWLATTVYGDAKELFLQAGLLYIDQVNPHNNPNLALNYLKRSAMLGDAEAEYLIKGCHLQEVGGDKNPKLAAIHVAKSAENGVQNAQTIDTNTVPSVSPITRQEFDAFHADIKKLNPLINLPKPQLEKLKELVQVLDLKETQLERIRKAVEFLDFDAVIALKERAKILANLIAKEEKELADTEKLKAIYNHPQMKDYYLTFYRCLSSIVLACTVLQSGKLEDTTSSKASSLADAIEILGGQIPGVSIGAKILTKLIRFWDARNKQVYLNMITRSFSDMEKNPKIIRKLALCMTMQRKEYLEELAKKIPERWEAFKRMLATLKDSFQGNDINNAVKKLAEADNKIILTAIAEDKLKLISPHDESLKKAFIKNCIATVLGKLVIEQTVTINVRAIAEPLTPSSLTPQSASRSATFSSESKSLSDSSGSDKTCNTAKILRDLQADIDNLKGMRLELADVKKSVEDLGGASGGGQAQLLAGCLPNAIAGGAAVIEDMQCKQAELLERFGAMSIEIHSLKNKYDEQSDTIARLEAEKAQRDKKDREKRGVCVVS